MARRVGGRGIFARRCLAPASKQCTGERGRGFQACRRSYISQCKIGYGY